MTESRSEGPQSPAPNADGQQNREPRRPVALTAIATLENGSTQAVSLLDLSYDGCGITTPIPLVPGDPVRLSIARRGVIDAEVRWYSDGKAGLVFKPESSAVADSDRTPRDTQRTPLSAQVAIKRAGRRSYGVPIADASPNGFKFEYVDRPEIGERVMVKLEGLHPLEATIRWIEGHNAGAKFDKPIHPAVFDLLLERMRAGA